MWNGQAFRDYADIDIQQMMGRAGRPQFDTSGTVVVMCNTNKLAKVGSCLLRDSKAYLCSSEKCSTVERFWRASSTKT